jgi:hypothetical protein
MAAIQQYKAKIDTQRPRAHPSNGPDLPTDQTWNAQLWASAMLDSLQQPGAPVQSSP